MGDPLNDAHHRAMQITTDQFLDAAMLGRLPTEQFLDEPAIREASALDTESSEDAERHAQRMGLAAQLRKLQHEVDSLARTHERLSSELESLGRALQLLPHGHS
jgi:uncharacterized protein YlxW (UPF0749 family)